MEEENGSGIMSININKLKVGDSVISKETRIGSYKIIKNKIYKVNKIEKCEWNPMFNIIRIEDENGRYSGGWFSCRFKILRKNSNIEFVRYNYEV
jgi:hypothetical protein